MRFQIEADPTGGLRVIGDIPDLRLCRLEGQNGIGKTLAVRLLQLVTGDQPWAGLDSAWKSLREHLGAATVRVDALRLTPGGPRASTLVWSLDSNSWPEHPAPRGPWNQASLNGADVSIERVRELLRVVRIAGDESLAQSLAVQIRRDLLRLQTVTGLVERTRRHWDARLESVEQLLGDSTAQSIGSREAEVKNLEESLASQLEVLASTEERRNLLIEVANLTRRRAQLVEQLPGLLDLQQELASRQADLRVNLSRLDEESAILRSDEKRTQETAAQLTYLESLYEKRRERLSRRIRAVNNYCEDLGITDSPGQALVWELSRETERDAAAARERRRTHDRAGMLLEITEGIDAPLRRGKQDGFGDEVIARAQWNALTIDQLGTAVAVRRDELAQDVGTEGEQLQQAIIALERRLRLLSELRNELRLLEVARHDVSSVRNDIEVLADQLSAGAAHAYRDLVDRRAAVLDELVDISARIGEVDRARTELEAEGDLQTVIGRIAELQDEGIDVEAAQDELATTEAELIEIRRDVDNLQQMRDRAITSLDGQYANIAEGADRLRRDSEFSWLKTSTMKLPARNDEIHVAARKVDRLRFSARRLRQDLGQAMSDLEALASALQALAERLDHELPVTDKSDIRRFSSEVVRYYQSVFAHQLASPETREALFDGGTRLNLDLNEMTTSWITPAGERRTRPLEAFSSGERAFAYTRVQLEAIKTSVDAVNRVAFLDEFGAYVAKDRLDELMSFIRRRALRELVDQVVVILPLSAPATEQERREIESQSYFSRDVLNGLAAAGTPI